MCLSSDSRVNHIKIVKLFWILNIFFLLDWERLKLSLFTDFQIRPKKKYVKTLFYVFINKHTQQLYFKILFQIFEPNGVL